jgi:hypothetical protein
VAPPPGGAAGDANAGAVRAAYRRDLDFLCAYLAHVGLCDASAARAGASSNADAAFAHLTRGMFARLASARNGVVMLLPAVRELALTPCGADICAVGDAADTLRSAIPNMLLPGRVPGARAPPFSVQGVRVDWGAGYAARAAKMALRHERHILTLPDGKSVTADIYALPLPSDMPHKEAHAKPTWPAFMPCAASLEGGAILFVHGASALNERALFFGAAQRDARSRVTTGSRNFEQVMRADAMRAHATAIASQPETAAFHALMARPEAHRDNGVHLARHVWGAKNIFVVVDAPLHAPDVPKRHLRHAHEAQAIADVLLPYTWRMALATMPKDMADEYEALKDAVAAKDAADAARAAKMAAGRVAGHARRKREQEEAAAAASPPPAARPRRETRPVERDAGGAGGGGAGGASGSGAGPSSASADAAAAKPKPAAPRKPSQLQVAAAQVSQLTAALAAARAARAVAEASAARQVTGLNAQLAQRDARIAALQAENARLRAAAALAAAEAHAPAAHMARHDEEEEEDDDDAGEDVAWSA